MKDRPEIRIDSETMRESIEIKPAASGVKTVIIILQKTLINVN